MARGPLIPGMREYDAPRRRRAPTVWVWSIAAVVAVTVLVVVAGIVSGIGPLRALGLQETPLNAVGWRATENPAVIQVAVALPESGLCTGDEVIVRGLERSNVVEVSAVRAAPRGSDGCAGIGIAGDRTWVDLSLGSALGERSVIRSGDRVPLELETGP
jgi:hypothetical protein